MPVSPIAYKGNSYKQFLQWTNEKSILGNRISQLIENHSLTLLDVGVGNGELTKHYINHFQSATLIEPHKENFETLLRLFPMANIVLCKLEAFDFTDVQYDFIVLSHVLMFIEKSYDYINLLHSVLKIGGKIIIILLDRDCGYLKFIDHFYSDVVTSVSPERENTKWNKVQEYLDRQGYLYEIFDERTYLTAPSVDDFLSLNDLYFNTDVSQLSSKTVNKMKKYLSTFQSKDLFSIDFKHKIFVVKKNN